MSQAAVAKDSCEAYLQETGGGQAEKILLVEGVCRIGRGPQNTVVVPDDEASRNHAMIHRDATGEYYLTDLGSRNGTAINHRRITGAVVLKTGDRITVGKHEFIFHSSQSADGGPAAPDLRYRETMAVFDQELVTVLVADIRDFTGLSQRLGETRLSVVLSGFIRETGAALRTQGTWGQKYIGDAVMALWVHERRAMELPELLRIFCGLEKLFQIAAGLQDEFGLDEPIRIGAGMNTGLACLGNMGSATAADYTALSEAVNRAFRLESATRQCDCDLALGPRTFQFLKEQDVIGDAFTQHTMALKGYSQAQSVYAASRCQIGAVIERMQQRLTAVTAAAPADDSEAT